MTPFIKIFLFSTGLHVFLFLHLLYAFRVGKWLLFTVPWVLLMAGAMLIHPLLGYGSPAQVLLASIESIWQALGMFMLAFFLLHDLHFVILGFLRRARSWKRVRDKSYRQGAKLVIALSIIFVAYAMYEAYTLRVTRFTISAPDLPDSRPKLRVVFLSDLHLNYWVGPRRVAQVTNAVSAQRPDVILLGGDTVDGDLAGRGRELELLREMKASCGKYAVLGNHDVAYGIKESAQFHVQAGFRVLRQEAVNVCGAVVAGVDDYHVSLREGGTSYDPVPLLRQVDNSSFVILLKHRPALVPESVGSFDLQLSGHSHGGQIWPLSLLVRRFLEAPAGLREYSKDGRQSQVYVTNGVGFARMPLRFLTPPEIVVIDLVRPDQMP